MMGTAVSLFYLRETNHLLATLTRNAAKSGELDDAALQRALPDGLVLRHLAQTQLKGSSLPNLGTERASASFNIELRHIAVAPAEVDRVDQAVFLSRPTRFSIVDGEPSETPAAVDGIDGVTIEVQSSGVKVTVTPDSHTMIGNEIPVWCLLLTKSQQITIVQSAVIPKNSNLGVASSNTVPFSVIPTGEVHDFLIMIRGFQPIWDQLQVGKFRTWTP